MNFLYDEVGHNIKLVESPSECLHLSSQHLFIGGFEGQFEVLQPSLGVTPFI